MKSDNIQSSNVLIHPAINRHILKTFYEVANATQSDKDVNYKSLYYFLFNRITDVVKVLDERNIDSTYTQPSHMETINLLKKLQYEVEDLFIAKME